jgi:hypothetical protein
VTLAGDERPVHHAWGGLSSECRLEQLGGFVLGQLLQLQTRSLQVLPERHDRIGALLAGAHGDDHERAARGQMQHERCGCGVEQLCVVDSQHDPTCARSVDEPLRAQLEDPQPIVGADARRDQSGQGTERDRCRRLGRLNPFGRRPVSRSRCQDLPREPCLADARRAADDDAAARVVPTRGGDPLQLLVAPDERPRRRRRHPRAAGPRHDDSG